jgi:hypothetical protein
MSRKTYQDNFTWALPLGENVIEHHDGAVSIAYSWMGLILDNCNNDMEVEQKYSAYYQYLKHLSNYTNLTIEHHFFREGNRTLADEYIEYGEKNIVRSKELGLFFRKELADHLGMFGRLNSTVTVLTLTPETMGLFTSAKVGRNKLKARGDQLLSIVRKIGSFIDEMDVLTVNQYCKYITYSSNRQRYLSSDKFTINNRFYLNQQLISKPEWEDGLIKCNGYYTRVILLLDYPDAKEGWFNNFSNLQGVDLAVTQIIKPLNVATENLKSAHQSNKMGEAANSLGGEDTAGKLEDNNSFRQFVSDNNLAVFGNCYVIKLIHHDKNILMDRADEFEGLLLKSDATISSGIENISMLYWRTSNLGQGYKSSFSRPDHHLQIGNMAPILTNSRGETKELQMLRLTSSSTLIGDNFKKNGIHHRLTAAKTGSGKTVFHASEICELFPLGFNFYIAEVGRGFEWVVELFGGDYFVLDAEKTVISPFPAYDLEYIEDEDLDQKDESTDIEGTLPPYIIGATIAAIMPILMGKSDFAEHEGIGHFLSAAEMILQACYLDIYRSKNNSPTLEDYLNVGVAVVEYMETQSQRDAAEAMLDNLRSFLSRSEGAIFKKADTIDFNKPIIGVDFSVLLEAENNDLAKYLLTFVAMRFRQLSFTVTNPCFIKADEYHEYVEIDPALMKKLERQMTKRGRKKGAFFSPISQAVGDMGSKSDNGESTLNQYTHKDLMYYGTEFGTIPELFKLSAAATDIWKSYLDPDTQNYNFRQCLRVKGNDFYDLHLTYPQVFNDLTNSNPDAVELKEQINKEETDTIKKLKMFGERYVKV